MRIRFVLPYDTAFGEQLFVSGAPPELGASDPARALPLRYTPGGIWTGETVLAVPDGKAVDYAYFLRDATGAVSAERAAKRSIVPADVPEDTILEIHDRWGAPTPADAVFTTAPFQHILPAADCPAPSGAFSVRVSAPTLSPGDRLVLVGDHRVLGNWNPAKGIPLSPDRYPFWTAALPPAMSSAAFAYKYVLLPAANGTVTWEDGDNRRFSPWRNAPAAEKILLNDAACRFRGTPWKGAGIAVPVFSLRTARSLGSGEFPDLRLLADWAAAMGLNLIQILPVQDTDDGRGARNAYPYGVTSVFALHPRYLQLADLVAADSDLAAEIDAEAERLNAKPAVDYEAVMTAKNAFLTRIIATDGGETLASEAFRDFFRENAFWLKPYAVYCALRDATGTADAAAWGEYRRVSSETVDRLAASDSLYAAGVRRAYFIQFHLDRQLQEAVRYARSLGVVLKGDIPIGVSKRSAEAWLHPELFRLDASAGAPPDFFSTEGQNWGFPIYNWATMALDGYRWWRQRLTIMARYCDAIRLDHVLGFFRIWAIPSGAVTALTGRFRPALAIPREELAARGITRPEQYCTPRITEDLLDTLFGRKAGWVRQHLLEAPAAGRYRFKAEYPDQRRLREALPRLYQGSDESRDQLLHRIYRLYDEVLLLPDDGTDGFHPRIGLDGSAFFQSLDPGTQVALRDIHDDYFYRRQEAFWEWEGRQTLSALQAASPMLLCAEDLGMVPACVPHLLEDLGILALRIQRVPPVLGRMFGDPATDPYLSVASPSTHDMPPLREWWRNLSPHDRRIYWEGILEKEGPPPEDCTPDLCRRILEIHLRGNSQWAVLPVQDLLGMSGTLRREDPLAERINNPANSYCLWDYRMHRSLEDLAGQHGFNAAVKAMMAETGRLAFPAKHA